MGGRGRILRMESSTRKRFQSFMDEGGVKETGVTVGTCWHGNIWDRKLGRMEKYGEMGGKGH